MRAKPNIMEAAADVRMKKAPIDRMDGRYFYPFAPSFALPILVFCVNEFCSLEFL